VAFKFGNLQIKSMNDNQEAYTAMVVQKGIIVTNSIEKNYP
jgi:hypothetical protein